MINKRIYTEIINKIKKERPVACPCQKRPPQKKKKGKQNEKLEFNPREDGNHSPKKIFSFYFVHLVQNLRF